MDHTPTAHEMQSYIKSHETLQAAYAESQRELSATKVELKAALKVNEVLRRQIGELSNG